MTMQMTGRYGYHSLVRRMANQAFYGPSAYGTKRDGRNRPDLALQVRDAALARADRLGRDDIRQAAMAAWAAVSRQGGWDQTV